MRDHLLLYLNGSPIEVAGEDAMRPLTELLRRRRRLVGTKVVCAEGDCGACTVLVGRPGDRGLRYEVVDACIAFPYQLDGTHVVTVEGLRRGGDLHPVQQAMVDCYGSQCGFCTPGMVMALVGLAEEDGALADPDRLRLALSGNLCRCTGYVQILEAAAAVESPPRLRDLYAEERMLDALRACEGDDVSLGDGDARLLLPGSLQSALAWRSEHPQARVVSGATDLGVLYNKGRLERRPVLCLRRSLPELGGVHTDGGVLSCGAGATWTEVERAAERGVPELVRILHRFGAPQIRNMATVGGNLMNGSPIADSTPFFFVTEAEIEVRSVRGARRLPATELYRGYKETVLESDELMVRVDAPLPGDGELLVLHKMSKRRDLDISTLTAAFLLDLDGDVIRRARIAFGGVAPVVLRLPATEALLEGERLELATMERAGERAAREITPISDVRGSAHFRLRLSANLLRKLAHDHGARNRAA
jgi:xanthine dehydrogenase small subunit